MENYLFLISGPNLPGMRVDRVLSAGIGVVVPIHWHQKLSSLWNKQKFKGGDLPPMDILYAAAVAQGAGAAVQLLDIGLEGWLGAEADRKTLAMLPEARSECTLWLCIRLNMPTLLNDLAFALRLKQSRPDARVIVYGAPVMTTLDHWVKSVPELDGVIYGELEAVIGSMLQAGESWLSTPGLIDPAEYVPVDPSKLFSKEIVATFDNWQRVKDLGDLPMPAWHLVPFDRYSATGDPKDCGAHVQASRGCPIGCTMCPYMVHEGRSFRANPVSRVIDDLEYLNKNQGITHVRFRDPNFGFDKKMMVDLAQKIIERDIKIEAAAELSLELLSNEQIDLLNRAGIKTILTGVETNDEECLASIGQKIKVNSNLEAKIRHCHSIGSFVFASFIVGAPEETWESLERTIKYAREIDAQCAATIMTPFPGTPMFYRAIEEGLLKPEMRYDAWDSYTPTMRSQSLSCSDLTTARLWFRVETIIPFKMRRARRSGNPGAIAKTAASLLPYYVVRQALRGYIFIKRNFFAAKPILPTSEAIAGAKQTRRALWRGRS